MLYRLVKSVLKHKWVALIQVARYFQVADYLFKLVSCSFGDVFKVSFVSNIHQPLWYLLTWMDSVVMHCMPGTVPYYRLSWCSVGIKGLYMALQFLKCQTLQCPSMPIHIHSSTQKYHYHPLSKAFAHQIAFEAKQNLRERSKFLCHFLPWCGNFSEVWSLSFDSKGSHFVTCLILRKFGFCFI